MPTTSQVRKLFGPEQEIVLPSGAKLYGRPLSGDKEVSALEIFQAMGGQRAVVPKALRDELIKMVSRGAESGDDSYIDNEYLFFAEGDLAVYIHWSISGEHYTLLSSTKEQMPNGWYGGPYSMKKGLVISLHPVA